MENMNKKEENRKKEETTHEEAETDDDQEQDSEKPTRQGGMCNAGCRLSVDCCFVFCITEKTTDLTPEDGLDFRGVPVRDAFDQD